MASAQLQEPHAIGLSSLQDPRLASTDTTREKSMEGDSMNSSNKILVLGATGQVGKLVAKNLQRSEASFSVGTRRKANLNYLSAQFGSSRFIDLDDPRTFDE